MAVYAEPPAVVTGQTMTATNWNDWVKTNFMAVWPYTTVGDIAYASAANQLNRLGIGAAGKSMRSDGTNPIWEGFRGASVYRNVVESIPNAAYTRATFTIEMFDTNNFWDAGNPSRLTVPRAGYYLVGGKIGWDINPTNVREVKLYINGSGATYAAMSNACIALSGVLTRLTIVFLVHLSAGDYVELFLWQNSGGALNHGGDRSYFWILDVGP